MHKFRTGNRKLFFSIPEALSLAKEDQRRAFADAEDRCLNWGDLGQHQSAFEASSTSKRTTALQKLCHRVSRKTIFKL